MKNTQKKPNTENGQSLFEVVVAIALSALIVTGIVAMGANSIQNSSYSRDKTLASNYVQEALEWVRQERDQNMDVFLAKAVPGTTYCLNSLEWPKSAIKCSNGSVIADTKFSREIIFPSCDGVCPTRVVEIKVIVYWNDSKGYHESSSFTDLSTR